MNPNFIITGVARCGTTSLYHYLDQHPEIGFSKIKEPKYFSSLDLNLPQNGPGDDTVFSKMILDEISYDRLFENLKSFNVVGEASSDYFYYHRNVIPRIKEKLGDVKIIICLRNPVERAFSSYNNLIRDSREKLSFIDGLKSENLRISNNWDWMWHYKKGSLYSDALEHFLNEFSNVKVVFFEDLKNKPNFVMKDIFSFLNVNVDVEIDVSTIYSTSGAPKSQIISMLTNRNNPLIFWMREVVLKLLPRKYLEKIAENLFKKKSLNKNTYEELLSFYKLDILKLEKLTNRNLKNWI